MTDTHMTTPESPERHDLLARSLVQIKQLRTQLSELREARHEPIAIVGVGLRLPGGISDPLTLREHLRTGFDAISGIPRERWDLAQHFDADPDTLGKMYTRHGAFLDSIDQFDAAFFGISPKEAAAMDPQQRLFLEVVHEALERAGIDVTTLEESNTSVFAGATTWDYGARQVFGRPLAALDPYVMSGNIAAFTSGRVSYTYGLQGQSMSIDTACSSSLVAVHLAVAALRRGESDLAIAGGVNVILAPEWNVVLSRARMMAVDGRCKTFDASADGYVRGEGCGIVVLKRWAQAQRDGDTVLALIRGSAVNQDGPASGITVPNGLAQQKVIRAALADARIEAASVGYVEAHGTGTSLGDPIEVRSLSAVYGHERGADQRLRLGSIKTNLGHLEPAAGVVGLIKAALSVDLGEFYPHLHLQQVNPEIDLAAIPAEIPTAFSPWHQDAGQPRRAGISSFGASGTNVHVIIEQVPSVPTLETTSTEVVSRLLVLSAKSEAALDDLVSRQREALALVSAQEWADFCATTQRGRAPYPFRLAVTASDPASAREQLAPDQTTARRISGRATGAAPKVSMLFAGQGAQSLGMGRQLYRQQPAYRDAFDQCNEILQPILGSSILDIIDGTDVNRSLDQTAFTQPAMFAVEYSLYRLWQAWGIEPVAVLGHSVGQYIAATVAGVFDLSAGLTLIAARGRMMQELTGEGAMFSLMTDEVRAKELLGAHADTCSIAAVNGATSVVISGLRPAIDAVADKARAAGIRVKPLTVSHAFHSPQMDPMLDAFRAEVARFTLRPPTIPLVCNLDGGWVGAQIATADYWCRHLREPVRFGDGLTTLSQSGHRLFVEASPRPALASMAKTHLSEDHVVLPSLREGKDELGCMLNSLGALFVRGAAPRWDHVDPEPRCRMNLPTYPFQRKRHWVDTEAMAPQTAAPQTSGLRHPLVDRSVPNPLALAQYEAKLSRNRYRFLGDFVIDEVNVVNIGVYLEFVRGALEPHLGHNAAFHIDELTMQRACLLRDDGPTLQLVLHQRDSGFSFSIHGDLDNGTWVEHCSGRVVLDTEPLSAPASHSQWSESVTGDQLYASMQTLGIELGPTGRWITAVDSSSDRTRAAATLRGPSPAESVFMQGEGMHPGSIDALFQAAYAVLPDDVPKDSAYMLIGVGRMHIHPGQLPVRVEIIRKRWDAKARALTVDLVALDSTGRVVIFVAEAMLKYASRAMLRAQLAAPAQPGERMAPNAPGAVAPGRQALRDTAEANRRAVMEQRIIQIAARVFGAKPSELERELSLLDLGLDSLMAVELKRSLETDFGIPVALSSLLEGPSVADLAPRLIELLQLDPGANQALEQAASNDSIAMTVIPDPDRAHEPFSLTDLQQAYLIGRGGAFELGNVSTYFFLEVDIHDLDLERAELAWNQMISRHGMLRAVFTEGGRQRVLASVPNYRIAVTDVMGLDAESQQRGLADVAQEVRSRVFDTSSWPLFDIRATRIDSRTTRLHLGIDALIVDAWSTSMVFEEWARVHRGETLAPVALTFRDYMVGIDELRRSKHYAQDLEYWERRVATLPPAPELPLACAPDSIAEPQFGHRTARLTPEAWTRFQTYAREAKVTPSAALCAVYSEVIATWSRSRHFTLNLLFFNRLPLHPEVKSVAANFSSTTLLEIDAREPCDLRARAQRIQHQLADDLDHGLVTGVEVLRLLNRGRGGRGASMPVVFASTINLRARDSQDIQFGLTSHLFKLGNGGREVGSSIRTPQVWLDHQVLEEAGGLVFNWDVVEDLFPAGMIDAMFARYEHLLHRLGEDASAWTDVLGRIELPAVELEARASANATDTKIVPQLLHTEFLRRAERDPERMAVISTIRSLTYGELDASSEHIARQLLALDLGPDRLVAVFLPKGWKQIAAVLGIHKAQAAYLPIDPALPDARVAHLFSHAGVKVVVTAPGLEARITDIGGVDRVVIGPRDTWQPVAPERRLQSVVDPESLAYVIYTSGSTGLPKGVAVSHAAAWNTIVDINQRFGIGPDDRSFAISSLSFDLSVYDVFGLLSVGGALVVPSRTEIREPAAWIELVRSHRVTVWNSVPALAQMVTEHAAASSAGLGALRLTLLSGDWIPVALPDAMRRVQPAVSVVSLGGATEAAIWSIIYPIAGVPEHWPSIPYGRPLANQRFAVLDGDLTARPVHVPGELYIAGDGLAMGYWNDPERTGASFFVHPRTGERMYRTGDLGRYLPDGNIEFLGREDGQVKVQGYRIELGEIDAALDRIPELRASATAAVGERTSGKTLVAYLVARGEAELDLDAIRRRLESMLPSYMVPTIFMTLSELPLTSNGKVDRKALPTPNSHSGSEKTEAVPPRDDLELQLSKLWSELLNVNDVGVFDNFFSLGGQSFLAMRLMARIRRQFGVSLPLGALLSNGTIAAQAEMLRVGATLPWTPQVEIQAGQGVPVVLVHPVGGNVLCYLELARGLSPRPVVGLTAHGLQPGQSPLQSISEMATSYLNSLRSSGMPQPLRIIGWSLGGVVALEMARQAEAEGLVVELVVLLDSRLEARATVAPRTTREMLDGFLSDLGRAAGLPSVRVPSGNDDDLESELTTILAQAKSESILPPDLEPDAFYRLWQVYRAGIDSLDTYRPEPVNAAVVELVAVDQDPKPMRVDWSQLCRNHERRDISGDHYTLLMPPHRDALVDLLSDYLDSPPPPQPVKPS